MIEHDECAITDLSNQVNERDKENQQLKARIVRLEQHLSFLINNDSINDHSIEAESAILLNETPEQALSEIQADAVASASNLVKNFMMDYAASLFKAGKDHD